MPVINVRNIGFGTIRDDKLEFISESTRDRLAAHVLRVGDVVFGRKGAVERHVLIRTPQDGWFQGSDCIRMRFDSSRVVPAFASAFFLTPEHQQWMKNHCSHAATMASLNQPILERITLPLPPVAVQRRIAGILSAYDDLIENCERRIRVLDEMARSLYREWFVDRAPSGWKRMPLVDVVEINPKVNLPKDQAVTFVPMSGLGTQGMLIHEVESRATPSGSRFQNGDTLFARITPCLENGKTGFVNFLPTAESGACGSTEFIVMRGLRVPPEFVYCLARSDDLRAHAIKSMSGATGRQRVQEACFDTFMVALPPADSLDRFVAIVRASFDFVHRLGERVKNLRTTRDLLLPRLLSGQLSVDDAA